MYIVKRESLSEVGSQALGVRLTKFCRVVGHCPEIVIGGSGSIPRPPSIA